VSIIKSFSVGNGDMFYIEHNSDNFTIIDCYLSKDNKEEITDEILFKLRDKDISRFISTHPDEDHIQGLEYLDEKIPITNFYCVQNEAEKETGTTDFLKYCALRDSTKAFHIYKGISRKWMNQSDNERGSSGINILWPDTSNSYYQEQLDRVKNGESPNNISIIMKYSLENGVKVLWMGDLETDFIEKVKDEIVWSEVDILFAPHHGRESGLIPSEILAKLNPKIIVIGEAPSKHLNYYRGYNKITQNSAWDITFECLKNKVHIYASNPDYSVGYLDSENVTNDINHYIGTLNL
jgi:beta-lactamase superfamily II metal-dependent hydrolase